MTEDSLPTIALVSPNVSATMGGEAIKALQYAQYLIACGRKVVVFAHSRCRTDLEAAFSLDQVEVIEDDWVQAYAYKSVILRPYVPIRFHREAARRIAARFRPDEVLIHYIAPVSPVILRRPPRGYAFMMGPMTGNIYFPPGFEDRMSRRERFRARFHGLFQRISRLSGEKRRAKALLVSGYERTRDSLLMAGAEERQIVDVVDSGVNERISDRPRLIHEGENRRFVALGRLIPYKGFDLAIRAVARTERASLDIFGKGPLRGELEALAAELGVAERVRFMGLLDNAKIPETYAAYRALLFPTLAEANGIVMQEAMMLGLPVITMRWGGPSMLADDASAIFIDPESEMQVVADLAAEMDALAIDPARAEAISVAARDIAEARFAWDKVAASWLAAAS